MKPTPESIAAVDAAITSRRSIRAFLPTPVPREVLDRILEVASRAPSGTNTQPWKVYVLTGAAKQGLSAKIQASFAANPKQEGLKDEYNYYPAEWRSPFIDRRRKVGFALYNLVGIAKGDTARMQAQAARNYDFFDAPVGLIFAIDRIMGQGSWMDYGMFLQNIMVAARARGLDTCPQAAFTPYHAIIQDHVGMPANEMLVCGMSMGYANPDAIENTLVTEREPVNSFTQYME
jgi:nitroreductase